MKLFYQGKIDCTHEDDIDWLKCTEQLEPSTKNWYCHPLFANGVIKVGQTDECNTKYQRFANPILYQSLEHWCY